MILLAAVLLLLMQPPVKGMADWTANCTTTKACWVSEQCSKTPHRNRDPMDFFLTEKDEHFAEMIPDCRKYLTVEPREDEVIFEIMHSDIEKDDKVTLAFREGKYFECEKQQATTNAASFRVTSESKTEIDHFFCRFKVYQHPKRPNSNEAFYTTYTREYDQQSVVLTNLRTKEKNTMIDYNEVHFRGRVPCSRTIFLDAQLTSDEHILKPSHNFYSREYTCAVNYTMSRKLFENVVKNIPDKHFAVTTTPIKCNLGNIQEDPDKKVASAKCHRKRYTLCDEVCPECTGLKNEIDNEMKRTIQCNTTFMVINNGAYHTKLAASCSEDSTPDSHKWKFDKLTTEIADVMCTSNLDCNIIYPFGELDCDNCSKPIPTEDGLKCENGGELVIIEDGSNARRKVKITCDDSTGKWIIDGNTQSGNKEYMKSIKMGCIGGKKKKEIEPQPAAANSNNLVYIACSIGGVLLLLALLLLLYFCCCRRARKEEPKPAEPSPPPPTKTTESSVVEQPISAPPSIAPAESESDHPWQYSGKRVQFINMSQEKLREIEPEGDPTMEYSARDKTDSDRSKPSQVGGQTTEGANPTFTGRVTDKTNEVSRTMAPGDESRSDASNGRDSTVGDRSRTGGDGGGGGTPKIGKEKKEPRQGPRVAFRERVSYETDTKSRDQPSFASMHTAPEQPQPRVERTQSKDEPSRDQKAFGKERTRTTQATKETNEDGNKSQDSTVGKRSKSRVTDDSKTG